MDIKPIKTDADYRAALKEIGMLMTAEPDTLEGEKLDVLVTLVEAYEQKHYPLDLTDDKHLRLKALAQHRHVSVNKLVEELSTQALVKPIRRSAVKLSRRVHHGLLKWGVSLQTTRQLCLVH
ncbi:MAG: hypothetical protein WBN81_13215, partial [Gammaproteobacteria bacterium]